MCSSPTAFQAARHLKNTASDLYTTFRHISTHLKRSSRSAVAFFVPSHAEACEDVSELAQYNIDTANEIAGRIKVFCAKPVNFEALLKRLFDEYALELSFEQYALVGSTVKSYLAWLMDKGQLKAKCESNLLLWEAAE